MRRRFSSAEAASVFLVDRKAQELVSTVNSTGGEIRSRSSHRAMWKSLPAFAEEIGNHGRIIKR